LTAQYVGGNKGRRTKGTFPVIDQVPAYLQQIFGCCYTKPFVDHHGQSVLAWGLFPSVEQAIDHVRPCQFRHSEPPLTICAVRPRPSPGQLPTVQPSCYCLLQYVSLTDSTSPASALRAVR